jgi:hypothetical protein
MRIGLCCLFGLIFADTISIALDSIADGVVNSLELVESLQVKKQLEEFTVDSPNFVFAFDKRPAVNWQVKLNFNGYNERILVKNAIALQGRSRFLLETNAKDSFVVRVERVYFHLVPHSCVPFLAFVGLVGIGGFWIVRIVMCC